MDLSFANPITGVGVNCFTWAHYLARVATDESYLAYHEVHNSYLQVSAEVGLIGFGIFVSIVGRSFLALLRVSRFQAQPETHETSEMSALAGFMLLGFVGLLVSGFFLSQGYSVFFTLYFALAAAMRRLQVAGPSSGNEATRGAADTAAVRRWGNSRVTS
jgi:O-antigen ligase